MGFPGSSAGKEFACSAAERKVKSLSHVRLFATPWTVAYQAPQSMEFFRQEYWSGLPFPSPGESSQPRYWTHVSCILGRLYFWATREAQCSRRGFNPWVGKIPWRRTWPPTSVFLSAESFRTEEPAGLLSMGSQRADMTEWVSTAQYTQTDTHTHTHEKCKETARYGTHTRKSLLLMKFSCWAY